MFSTRSKRRQESEKKVYLYTNYSSDHFAKVVHRILGSLDPNDFGGIRFMLLSSRFSLLPHEQALLRRACRLLRRHERGSPLSKWLAGSSDDEYLSEELISYLVNRSDGNTPYVLTAVRGEEVLAATLFRLEYFQDPHSKTDQRISGVSRLKQTMNINLSVDAPTAHRIYHLLREVDHAKGDLSSRRTENQCVLHNGIFSGPLGNISKVYYLDLLFHADEIANNDHIRYALSQRAQTLKKNPNIGNSKPLVNFDLDHHNTLFRVFLLIADTCDLDCFTQLFDRSASSSLLKSQLVLNSSSSSFVSVGEECPLDVEGSPPLSFQMFTRRADSQAPWFQLSHVQGNHQAMDRGRMQNNRR